MRSLPSNYLASALRIAIVDDSRAVRESLELLLAGDGYHVQAFGSAEDFLSRADELCAGEGRPAAVDVLLADLRMPGLSGLELIEALNSRHCGIPNKAVMSAFWTDMSRTEANALNVTTFEKANGAEEILSWLEQC